MDTRQRIIQAARELFWSQGFEATGMKDILTRAGARSGSLYYFFPGKDDVLLAVLDWYLANLESQVVEPAFARTTDPLERIFVILAGYRLQLEATGFTRGCPVGNLAIEVDGKPAARERIARNFTNWSRAIERCLNDAGRRLPADLDRAGLAEFILVVMEGAVMLSRAHRSIEPFDRAVTQLRGHFERLQQAAPHAQPVPNPSALLLQAGSEPCQHHAVPETTA